MVKIYFNNGDVIEDKHEWDKVVLGMQKGGLRMWKPQSNMLVPLVPCNINYIELEEEEDVTREEPSEVEPSDEGDAGGDIEEDVSSKEVRSEDPKEELTEQEKKDAFMAEMKRRSSCTHPDEDDAVWFQATSVGKDKKPAKRYFHVCSSCGVRKGKYVKASSLTDEQKENAKLWDK
jgi:hypothetical protein